MKISPTMNLSAAKAALSEIIRNVRRTGHSVVITVDGEPAARINAVEAEPRRLTAAEAATVRALMDAVGRIPRPTDAFDAVALVADGRR
ncbi:MAG TPA: type II toxin-antitoxin system prevent-host-death family antitoxin [Polyangia bacterium]|jgi:prevent-host-death family protein